ncbi:MAG: hypothetical protein AUK34_04650 [Ignavibacteria bacterium CG2_30_36_16]|nr:response regulator [Ignavibacteria bacterium]OIP61677.1 MAG: hypothetical protein AUK34_04650 [Ignavibacteria bacterium CG2_30_36_16]
MKISYRILFINFIIVLIIVGSAAFAFYSIMYNLLSSQHSKYLSNSVNNFVYFYSEFLQETEYDFLYLMRDDVDPQIKPPMLEGRNVDFILKSINDSTKMLVSVASVNPVNINSPLFTIEEFNEENPYAIIKGYRYLDGTYYYFGKILGQEELTGLAKKIGAEIAFIWQKTPAAVSNEAVNNIYTYDIKSAYDYLSRTDNFRLYSKETENSDLLASLFRPSEYSSSNYKFEFIIFTTLNEVSELKTNLKYILIIIGFSGVLLSLILTFLFTDRMRSQITQLSKATEITKQGNFKNKIPVKTNDELGQLAKAFNIMLDELDKNQKAKQEYSEFITLINQNATLQEISDVSLKKIIKTCKFTVGAIFMVDGEETKIISSFGIKPESSTPEKQDFLKPVIASKEPMEITSADDLPVVSDGILSFSLKYILIQPILYNNKVIAVLELGGVEKPTDEAKEYLSKVLEQLAVGLINASTLMQLENLVVELKNLNHDFQEQNVQVRKQNETLIELHQKLKDKANELEVQKKRAEESTKLKSQFLASMSHELRTPMNSILGLTELVLDQGNLSGKDWERISVVLKSSRRLMSLIDDILDLSKIEAGKMELREEEVLLDEIILEAETSISPLIINKNINLRVIRNAEPQIVIRTDRGKVIQVLINLMANAIKFTQRGNVVLNISQPSKDQLQFDIIDTGIGISPENQKLIFEEFRQVDGTSTKKYNGTGLGLAICKKIAGMLNGSLSVESEVDKGSTFTFTIPLIKTGVKTDPKNENEELQKALLKPVLIVEEEPEIRLTMGQYLSSLGYNAAYLMNGEDVIEKLKKINPRAVVVDMNMKDADGWNLLQSVKSEANTSSVPVIAIMIKGNENKGHGIEVYDYYVKPADNNLNTLIKNLSSSTNKKIERIVLVDADNSEMQSVQKVLTGGKFILDFVKMSEASLDDINKLQPELIITSLMMKKGEGISLINKLKQTKSTKHIPIIAALDSSTAVEVVRDLNKTLEMITLAGTKHSLDVLKIVRDKLNMYEEKIILENDDDIIHDAPSIRAKIHETMRNKKIYKGSVLIVDDDPDTLFTLNEIVQSLGNKTILAKNGVECLEALSQIIPDLILLDIMMPEMDGFQTINNIKKKSEWLNIPVFAVTAKAMAGDKDVVLKHGFDDYITKPINANSLALKINQILSKLYMS